MKYRAKNEWRPTSQQDLLAAHQTLMQGLIDDVGQYRNTGVGIIKGKKVIHMAPSAERVNGLMFDLIRRKYRLFS
jgi:Fic family protein